MEIKDISATLPTRGPGRAQTLLDLCEIIVHRTDADTSTPKGTAEFHTGPERKWPHIAYHFYVSKDGAVVQTLPVTTVGCHAPPNKGRIGVVFVGLERDPLTSAQQALFPHLLLFLTDKYQIAHGAVRGHREVNDTHCPGDWTAKAVRDWRGA